MRTTVALLVIGVLAFAFAAERYSIRLFHPTVIGETELPPGDYHLALDGNHVVLKKRGGKETAETDVHVETSDRKHRSTVVRYNNGDGKFRISEIRLGGTYTKLVFN